MKKQIFLHAKSMLISSVFFFLSLMGLSQEPVSFVSPEIHDDQEVTFRFFDPDAKEVILTGDFLKTQSVSIPMKRDDQGLWQITVGPLLPCIYSYSFNVDGLKVLDQDNGWIKPGRNTTDNFFLVPGGESADILLPSSVPHGEVRMVYYQSKALNRVKRMHIYFPPGYNESQEKYPVCYLLHGGGDHDDGWISLGRANHIMDNLIAQGKTKPMIVVMPSIWGVEPPAGGEENNILFEESFIQDIIPFVEQHYRVLANSENRAIGGLSIGNLQMIFFDHIDKFNYIGTTSCPALGNQAIETYQKKYPGRIESPENANRIKVWIGDGTNAMTYEASKQGSLAMPEFGYQTIYYETDGIHGWPWFRRYFAEWSTHLFK